MPVSMELPTCTMPVPMLLPSSVRASTAVHHAADRGEGGADVATRVISVIIVHLGTYLVRSTLRPRPWTCGAESLDHGAGRIPDPMFRISA